MKVHKSIHPFPARMAPEIAFQKLSKFKSPITVLDPMTGSGTVLRIANSLGHHTIGFDMDPLAVLMSKVWITPVCPEKLLKEAELLLQLANELSMEEVKLDWIDSDKETSEFIDFWFGECQKNALRKISYLLHKRNDVVGSIMKIAMSRIIITKDNGASLARDVSHSRPHRVKTESNYNVIEGFLKSIKKISKNLENKESNRVVTNAEVSRSDARRLSLNDCTIDYVLTSPPYLNAIDYLRGHKLALVWLGYKISELRSIRGSLVGAEKALLLSDEVENIDNLLSNVTEIDIVSTRMKGVMRRFALDMRQVMSEISRVLRSNGLATLIVGNCNVKGVFFDTAKLMEVIAQEKSLTLIDKVERPLNPTRRYLPPPTNQLGSLSKRMSSESIITFSK